MRISDWSSDVCSSDLTGLAHPSHTVVVELYRFVRGYARNVEFGMPGLRMPVADGNDLLGQRIKSGRVRMPQIDAKRHASGNSAWRIGPARDMPHGQARVVVGLAPQFRNGGDDPRRPRPPILEAGRTSRRERVGQYV